MTMNVFVKIMRKDKVLDSWLTSLAWTSREFLAITVAEQMTSDQEEGDSPEYQSGDMVTVQVGPKTEVFYVVITDGKVALADTAPAGD